MKRKRIGRPDHQTVVAYLALFLVLATGTAYAAATIGSDDVVNGSLKSVDLKNKQGVKGADVRDDSLASKDFGRGERASIRGADVGANAVGGGQINEASLAASRVVARLGGAIGQPVPDSAALVPLPNNAYTQAAGEPNEFIAGGQITFSAACTGPRSVAVYLLVDSPVLAVPSLLGTGSVNDGAAGTVSRRIYLNALTGTPNGMALPPLAAAAPHQLYLYADRSCNAGAGVTLDSLLVDVVGHR